MFFYIKAIQSIFTLPTLSLYLIKPSMENRTFKTQLHSIDPTRSFPNQDTVPIPMITPSDSNLTWHNSFLALANNSKAHASIWAQIGVESIQVGEWGSNGAVDKSIWCEAKAQLFDEMHEPKFPSLKLRCTGLGLGNGHRGGKLKFLVQIWFGFSLPIQIDLNFIISHWLRLKSNIVAK